MKKFKKMLLAGLAFGAPAVFAQGGGYSVPAGVTSAIEDAEAAAEGLANAAIPGVASIALAFAGLVVIWLIVKALRRAAR